MYCRVMRQSMGQEWGQAALAAALQGSGRGKGIFRAGAGLAILGLAASGLAVPGLAVLLGVAVAPVAQARVRAAAPAAHGSVEVALSSQPGSALDRQARDLNADDLATARRHHEKPLVMIGSAPLSTNARTMGLFVQVQSASLCGSAGCSTDVYVQQGGGWKKVLDSVSGPIRLLGTSHGGMRDILVDGSDRWIWRHNTYVDTLAAPDVPGLKASVEKHQAAMRGKTP
ncbi:hypothetical protein [Acetobacter garciniae]|uniref:hypothetical protein n=1 Tax=Acetobacter garciniae TaxID=2817435 RepID=UPI001E552CF5|nr:hypothetical protein [Acetobacter garciniae]